MNKKKNYLTGVVLLLCAYGAAGQPTTTVQREVEYQTSTFKCFKIPCDKDPDSLSQLDLVYLERKPPFLRKVKFDIQDYWLRITNSYPQLPRYERDYEFQMGKSVTDKWGTRLYYHNDSMYYNLENEIENEDYLLSAAEIENYGFFNGLFGTPIAEIVDYCEDAGIPVYVWGEKLLIVQEDSLERTEIETDFEQLYFETRLYRNNVHILSDRTDYQLVNGYIIPAKSVRVHYSELLSETRYQITEVETYENYTVTGRNGDTLVDWTLQNEQEFAITVSPNPADTQIVVHFSPPLDDDANLKIKNVANNIVWERTIPAEEIDYVIDITSLESGLYTVVCVHENDTAEAGFVKEGIGQYSVQVNIDIQVVPNPATDYLRVLFSENINAVMNVKIIDPMGTKYLDKPMYITGNALQISGISYLPAGIYYVFCINSEWMGYTQFIRY